MRVPSSAVEVNFGEGEARFGMSGLRLRDFGSIDNSLGNGPSAPSVVSFSVRWSHVIRRRQVHNATLHVSGLFLDTGAFIEWTGHNESTGFTYTASHEGQNVISAQLGHERNGSFFE